MTGIYMIQFNAAPDKFYIGSAADFNRRKTKHLSDLRLKKHHSPLLQRYYNKYGEHSIDIQLLIECKVGDLLRYEQMAIDILNPLLNICKVAGNTMGYRHSAESIKKISEAGIGNKYTLGRSPWNKGKMGYKVGPACDERKEKARLNNIGKQARESHPNWGKPLPESTRIKISENLKGHTVSDETRKKISQKLTGAILPLSQRGKISAALKGKKKQPFTAEHKRKLSEAKKRHYEIISTTSAT